MVTILECLTVSALAILWVIYRVKTRPDPNVLPMTQQRKRLNLKHERDQQRYVE